MEKAVVMLLLVFMSSARIITRCLELLMVVLRLLVLVQGIDTGTHRSGPGYRFFEPMSCRVFRVDLHLVTFVHGEGPSSQGDCLGPVLVFLMFLLLGHRGGSHHVSMAEWLHKEKVTGQWAGP